MRRIAIAAFGFAALCACEGVKGSTVPIVDAQPVYPLRVHPSLSGRAPPPNARAPGRGTTGSPGPFVTTDYPDPPEMATNEPRASVQPRPHPSHERGRAQRH